MSAAMSDKAKLIDFSNGIETNSKRYGTFTSNSNTYKNQEAQEPCCLCSRRDVWAISIVSIIIAICITTTLAIGIPSIRKKENLFQQKPPIFQIRNSVKSKEFKMAAISSDDPRCSEIGNKIMKKNGSAIDAAISTLLCLEVVNPQHSGIGGGFFMTLYDQRTRESVVMDAREYAPANIPLDSSPPFHNGFWKIHQRFGRLPWSYLFQPIIDMCINGYRVDENLAKSIQKSKDIIFEESSLRELFVNNITGKFLEKNDILKRPVHAKTLQTIAKDGISAFYNGSLGKFLVSEVQEKGGILTLDDMAKAKSVFKNPLNASTAMHELNILTLPPPSSGSTLIYILNLLAQFNVSQNDAINYQRIIEAFKFAFALRTLVGDEAFVDTKEVVENQTSVEFAKITAQLIVDNATFSPEYYLSEIQNNTLSQDSGTSHVSVIDKNGLAVAVTSTINTRFGAKFRSRLLDIFLNDEMNDFSDSDSIANSVKPGKKPISSMVPAIFIDKKGDVVLVIGGAGGKAILTSVSIVAWNYLHRMKSLEESVNVPRVHHHLIPNVLYAETTIPKFVISRLKSFGHNISEEQKPSHVNAIARTGKRSWLAVSDSRMDSGVAGF